MFISVEWPFDWLVSQEANAEQHYMLPCYYCFSFFFPPHKGQIICLRNCIEVCLNGSNISETATLHVCGHTSLLMSRRNVWLSKKKIIWSTAVSPQSQSAWRMNWFVIGAAVVGSVEGRGGGRGSHYANFGCLTRILRSGLKIFRSFCATSAYSILLYIITNSESQWGFTHVWKGEAHMTVPAKHLSKYRTSVPWSGTAPPVNLVIQAILKSCPNHQQLSTLQMQITQSIRAPKWSVCLHWRQNQCKCI